MKNRWPAFCLLCLLVILSFGLRLMYLSDMEYNYDEKKAWELSGEMLSGLRWPLVGLDSSVGIPNPPGFVVMIAIFRAIARTPVGVAAIIAMLNAVAIIGFLLYFRTRCDKFVVWTASFLFATTPWAVIFSRKIWAQDLLAPFSVLLMIYLHRAIVENRARNWLGVVFSGFMLLQLHLSAIFLAVAIPLILLMYVLHGAGSAWRPGKQDWLWLRRGIIPAGILFLPYILLILKNLPHALRSIEASRIPDYSKIDHLIASFRAGAQILTGLFFETTLLGDVGRFYEFVGARAFGVMTAVYCVLLVFFIAGFIAWVGKRNDGYIGLYGTVLLLVHFAYILLASSRTGASYFLILYPIPFLAVASGVALVRNKAIRCGLAIVFTAVNLGVTLYFLVFVHQNHDGLGGYGIPFRHQLQ